MSAPLARAFTARLALCLLAAALAGCAGSGVKGNTAELKTASDQTPAEKRASIRLQLAIGYFQDGKLEVALDEVKQAIAADPDFADAYGVRALIYTQMGEKPLAEENFLRALKLAPRNPELGQQLRLVPVPERPRRAGHRLVRVGAEESDLPVAGQGAAERRLVQPENEEASTPPSAICLTPCATSPIILPPTPTWRGCTYERRDYQRAGFFINRVKAAAKLDSLSAEVLWLAVRIDRKLGDKASEASLGTLLRRHHPGSPEYAAFQRGAFDE